MGPRKDAWRKRQVSTDCPGRTNSGRRLWHPANGGKLHAWYDSYVRAAEN